MEEDDYYMSKIKKDELITEEEPTNYIGPF